MKVLVKDPGLGICAEPGCGQPGEWRHFDELWCHEHRHSLVWLQPHPLLSPTPAELAARAVKELSDENRRLRLVIAALTTTPPLFERKP